jgi:hypothetical protein
MGRNVAEDAGFAVAPLPVRAIEVVDALYAGVTGEVADL